MSILRLWRKFRGLSWRRRSLLLEAAFWLTVARLAGVFVCFPRIARHIGCLHAPADLRADPSQDRTVAREISWAIDRSARLLPVQLVCLPRALAAWQMLHLRGIWSRVHCGALRDPERATLTTHAWVDACGVEVTGYPEAHHCVEIGFFAQ
ncbi:MAG TPA: lasso peptide biosynthesis B2 protein [Acidobacteriaceae bacterium]